MNVITWKDIRFSSNADCGAISFTVLSRRWRLESHK
uniref:Uncharacterized protein n=1 Tax=Rhizophora mucronata TaxID=61149 RepID=A0A2P2QD25_RHIMU